MSRITGSGSGGKASIRGVFSSFQKGTTSSHPNCKDGADGGPGVSCAVLLDVDDYSGRFDCIIENIGGTTWRGTLHSTATGQSVVIGEYSLPDGAGGIKSSQVGFLEYFLANGNSAFRCSNPFKTEVSYYYPTSNTSDCGVGSIQRPYEYGSCVGEQAFAVSNGSDYWTINSGF